jgi:hypothetical protein
MRHSALDNSPDHRLCKLRACSAWSEPRNHNSIFLTRVCPDHQRSLVFRQARHRSHQRVPRGATRKCGVVQNTDGEVWRGWNTGYCSGFSEPFYTNLSTIFRCFFAFSGPISGALVWLIEFSPHAEKDLRALLEVPRGPMPGNMRYPGPVDQNTGWASRVPPGRVSLMGLAGSPAW